jgi:hypothetical protein
MKPRLVSRDECESAPQAASTEGRELSEIVRRVLVREGVRESRSDDEEGVFLVVESRSEVSLQYHTARRDGLLSVDVPHRAQAEVLKCCAALARHGFALTLVLSPRTLALYVRLGAPHAESFARANRSAN